jgi:type IV pilus assembly protein PilQ
LDVPVSQVMIESRIVIANDDFSRDLGVRAGVTASNSNATLFTSGSGGATDSMVPNPFGPGNIPAQNSRYNVNFPAPGNAGRIAMAVLGGNYLVDLELSALQTEGRGEVVSNPRVVTSNQRTAKIEQGVDIPYQEASASGATSVSFKKAVLSLEVTPQITPDERVSMDLKVNKDSVGGIFGGVPSIDTRSVETQVLVDNGDTVVLGGIYEQSTSEGASKVPLFGDIPLLGALFRSNSRSASKNELLIFVTPRILKEGMRTGME